MHWRRRVPTLLPSIAPRGARGPAAPPASSAPAVRPSPRSRCTRAPCRSLPRRPRRRARRCRRRRARRPCSRSSENMSPSNPSRPRRMSCSQTRENPAGDAVHGRIDHVRGHDGLQALLRQHREGNEVVGEQRVQRALVHRQVDVRIRGDEAVPGKVLADRGASARVEAAAQARREMRDGVRIAVEARGRRSPRSRRSRGRAPGVKLKSTPCARSSRASSSPSRSRLGRGRARRRGPTARPACASRGMAVKPSRKRCTRPPSWSTQISSDGVRSARIDAVSAASCAHDAKLRVNRIDAAGERMQRAARGRRR